MKIPNHKSSFQKIQKWRKMEILLDPNSKPQKFFKKNPEMEKLTNVESIEFTEFCFISNISVLKIAYSTNLSF